MAQGSFYLGGYFKKEFFSVIGNYRGDKQWGRYASLYLISLLLDLGTVILVGRKLVFGGACARGGLFLF